MKVRFFAGAAEAAGAEEVTLDAKELTVKDAVGQLGQDNPRLAEVLRASSLLADGLRVSDPETSLAEVAQLDVLPPFAGG
ncbi:MAG: MoaD/ThiS family protein [Propionibacteriaceae bacterium]|nr:MoaD/ThiS family protein [Propionibacteriaceae bacterium]